MNSEDLESHIQKNGHKEKEMDLQSARQLRSNYSLQETPNSVNGKQLQLESVSSVSSLSSEKTATYTDISTGSRAYSEDSPEQKRLVNTQILFTAVYVHSINFLDRFCMILACEKPLRQVLDRI